MPPTIILDYSLHDPVLSELGRTQCAQLKESLLTKLPKELRPELIIVSPMRRTVETALLALDWLIDDGVPIQAHAGWQENTAKPCDTGSALSEIAIEFPRIDFTHVDPVYPDKTSPAGSHYYYTKQAIVGRAQSALAELYNRPEKAIIVVSHSGFLRAGVTGSWYSNADYRIFDFESGPDQDGPITLKQWELTRTGGLGWSWEEKVVIGERLPE